MTTLLSAIFVLLLWIGSLLLWGTGPSSASLSFWLVFVAAILTVLAWFIEVEASSR